MDSYKNIAEKLERFSRKYYSKMLLKGALLFLTLGFLFFLAILGIEYFLWLNSVGRLVLFVSFIALELFLLYSYILAPIFLLLKLGQGITHKETSILIGKHFPEIGDKLLNLLELLEDRNKSELLMASIEQRSTNLEPIPFLKAIDFTESLKYAKYLVIPILIIGVVWLSGNLSSFFRSYTRVVNYDIAYEAPAPFKFHLLTNELNVLENEPFTLMVTTEGNVRPENVSMVLDGDVFFLEKAGNGYQYTFSPPLQKASFYFVANRIRSRNYELNVLKTPLIQDFSMRLDFPSYIGRLPEVIKSTGNAVLPEGTMVKWRIVGENTKEITLMAEDSIIRFIRNNKGFEWSQRIFTDFSYQLSTTNANVRNYETLDYKFTVVQDAYPTIGVNKTVDSLNANVAYFVGEASDDYGLAGIKLIYYPEGEDDDKQKLVLETPENNIAQFYYTFPSGLRLDAGRNYFFYFEATDNDAIHKGKVTKSQVFSQKLLDDNQLKNRSLEQQQTLLENMGKTLVRFKEQEELLRDINKQQKQKGDLNFNEQRQIKDFLLKQQQQEGLMQKFSEQLKENLNNPGRDEKLNKLLKERLERQEMEARKNERLLEELNKIADRIDKEELAKRLEELANKQRNSQRGLEQLLELTKRYYVTEKAAQLSKELAKLANEQNKLGDKTDAMKEVDEQKKLNDAFLQLSKELQELGKDNGALKKPMDLGSNKAKEDDLKKEQNEILEELNKEKSNGESMPSTERTNQKQKSAAEKIEELSEAVQQASAPGGEATMTEDAEMLRQVLDNLIAFSFNQEALYDGLKDSDVDIAQYSGVVRRQQELRKLFEHVDDSLFSLSLRRAEVSEFVNEQITSVYYNIDKSLDRIVEGQVYQGNSYQQYALTASNSLADFLAELLDNMQQSMKSGQGSGQGSGFQLPDIIKGQAGLKEKMDGMGRPGEESQKGSKSTSGQNRGGGKGEGKEGNGDGENDEGRRSNDQNKGNEQDLEAIYEIYKQQQQLRDQLERQLQDMINGDDRKLGEKLIKQMEDFQNDLLENGITHRSSDKMNTIQYELLKLGNAELRQGRKSERESTTNINPFKNPITTKPLFLDNYRNEMEILERQALPLQQIFKNKVKDYFKGDD